MTRVAPARRVALELISERRRRDGRMRDLLRSSQAMDRLDQRDRALASRLSLGVVATQGALELMIRAHLRRGGHLQPRVGDALCLAAYELCWLETPQEVAVSQGVELVRSCAPRAAGLANAVLRRIAQEDAPRVRAARESLADALSADGGADADAGDGLPAADVLAWACGMPPALAGEIVSSCGRRAAAEVAAAQLEPAPVYVAANSLMMDVRQAAARLEAAGLDATPQALPRSWELGNPASLARSGLVQEALAVPADLAAQMVARIAAPKPGERLLEVGQGRATKSLLLEMAADEMGGVADLVSMDSEEGKVRLATRRLAKAGLAGRVRSLAFDGLHLADDVLPSELDGLFDTVFLDAPCSGTGTLRRHPEIVWGLDLAAVGVPAQAADATSAQATNLPELQLGLLRAASARVRPGGALVYATCSLLAQENEEVVAAFLASEAGEDFSVCPVLEAPGVVALEERGRELVASCVSAEGMFRSHPRPGSFDGHFCARLIRSTRARG